MTLDTKHPLGGTTGKTSIEPKQEGPLFDKDRVATTNDPADAPGQLWLSNREQQGARIHGGKGGTIPGSASTSHPNGPTRQINRDPRQFQRFGDKKE